MKSLCLLFVLLSIPHVAGLSRAAAHPGPQKSEYAGQERRVVKALSEAEIESYLQGRGMGLAKPAELNGYPGPMHVLQLAEDLKLTKAQTARTQAIFKAMRQRAVALGRQIVAQECRLDGLFSERKVTPAAMRQSVETISRLQGQLRLAHLDAHLAMMKVLTPAQIAAYNLHRGYAHHGSH